jgi:hypothetical protein
MSRKMFMAGVTAALSLGFVGLVGNGVAAAKGKDSTGGGVAVVHAKGGGVAVVHAKGGGGGAAVVHAKDNTGGVAVVHAKDNTGGAAVVHAKKGGKKGGPVTLIGATTCSIHGKVTFNPPLVSGGTASSTVTVTGLLRGCTNASQGAVKLNNGHLSALVGTVSSNDCATLTSGVAPALSGGSIMWTPPSKVARSSSVSMPAGTGSVVTSGGKSVIQISYSGGSVGSGSFTNTGGSSVKVTSTQDTTQVSSRCTTGLRNMAFSGSATL